METAAFYIFAAITIVASLLVVGQRNPMYSVMLLITSFGALAGLYILLDAPFTAVTQIIIYAGAIMVLFLFVVMLLNVPRGRSRCHGPWPRFSGRPACASARCCRCCSAARFSGSFPVPLRRVGRTAGERFSARVCRVGELGGQHRQDALHPACICVRGDVDSHPRGDGRRRRPGAEGALSPWCR